MRFALIVLLLLAACRHEKVVLNPDKGKDTQREMTLGTAPGGVVTNLAGTQVELASLWESKRVLLVFYRGGWCPYCKKQLGELQQNQQQIEAAGATIVAVSADSVEDAKTMHANLALGFELYSDASLATITKWGVEDYANNISKPATYVIEPGGAITFKKVGERKEDRPTMAEIMTALE